jgi:NAD(P)-dependent dehydrogenase (short-subunit alcohol dehydrogenase family)
MGRLERKVVIVTGAGQLNGIGAVTASLCAREGARAVVADIDLAGAESVANAIRTEGFQAQAVRTDLAEAEDVHALVERTVQLFGGIDVLVNNAAATTLASTQDSTVEDMKLDVWDRTMSINLRGTMLVCKYAIPAMRSRGGGAIVNISSAASLAGDTSGTAYAVSKAGINILTKIIATQCGKDGIRCNAISPGTVRTPISEKSLDDGARAMLLEHHLTPSLGRPEDIAAAVLYLASDEASYVTGQNLGVDGGLTAHQPYYADLRRAASALVGSGQ